MKESGPRLGGGAFPAQGAQLLAEKDGCAVWQFQNESGEGTMTVYDVFPGVMLSFNDFHMARYESAYVARRPLFAIDHCREGRMEYAAGENAVAYTGAGDMKLDLRRQHTGVFRFPSSHYHGLTVAFDLETASSSLSQQGQDFPVTPEQIITRWQLGDYPKVVHGADVMEHIFGEMYRVPERIVLFQLFQVAVGLVAGKNRREHKRSVAQEIVLHVRLVGDLILRACKDFLNQLFLRRRTPQRPDGDLAEVYRVHIIAFPVSGGTGKGK